MTILTNCLSGLYLLLQDPVGIIIMFAMGLAGFLAYSHAIGDMAFASVFAMIPTVYAYCQHKIAIANLSPPRTQPPV